MGSKLEKFTKLLLCVGVLFIVCNACSSEDEKTYTYTIGIGEVSISGSSFDYLTAIEEAKDDYEQTFTQTGIKEVCDIQAKLKFAIAIQAIKAEAAKITDCSGYVVIVLTRDGEEIDSDKITFTKE